MARRAGEDGRGRGQERRASRRGEGALVHRGEGAHGGYTVVSIELPSILSFFVRFCSFLVANERSRSPSEALWYLFFHRDPLVLI